MDPRALAPALARHEIAERLGIERWRAADDGRVCAGCRYLAGRIFFAFEGPRPPLHAGCRCARDRVESEGLHGVALMSLVLAARANGRKAAALLDEARDRRRREASRTNRRLARQEQRR